jgi:ArsR family transcriptional regulator
MLPMRELVLFHAALADETRLRLLHLMKAGEICVCHLQGVLQTNQPKISRHLAYLRKAGLVEARRDGKWTHYRLKKSGSYRQKILAETFTRLAGESLIRKDVQRLARITCCPARYGLSLPAPPASGNCS